MHTQRLTLTLTALASAGLLLTACGTESGAGSEGGSGGRSVESEVPLTDIRWNVADVTVGGKKYDAPDDAYLKIGKDGRAGGSFGCNSAGADVKIKGDTLHFGETRLTKRACPEGRMKFEEHLTRALAEKKLTAKVDGDRLTLTTAKGDHVDLTSRAGEPDAPLTGTKWKVAAVGGDKSAAPLPKDVSGKVHLTFGEDGKVRGNLGCNDVTAKADAKDGRLTFGAPATTRKLCPGDTMATERKLLKLFDGPARYEIERNTLKLTAADGTVINASGDPASAGRNSPEK
ncbi:META domain-containing protein [Streptomyces sp. BG9H]|uniref:META domain-containing protein n=1 Tax=Streptomyces anatolicus TaxID=2675858 RepID=A0ABS6YL83_9ACTN|nr:META domain-containing protein [Streptomyces anatolicus]MBW5422176.1 META domain-containing protein [Streptomyces anatolicus]